ncbi:MAG: PHP domain-containing protein [Bacillota bacterium]
MRADLHMHTTDSDGRKGPEALFKDAASKGLDYIAITDHDVCRSVKTHQALSKAYGVGYIPGIELSTLYNEKTVHVLGYFTDGGYASKSMEAYYDMIRTAREERAKTFIKNLKHYYDIDISYDQLVRLSGGVIARPHIGKAIMENYPEYTHDDVFEKFIGNHTEAYVPSSELPTEEGIELLKRHGAVVVLAHPVLLNPKIHDEVLELDFDGLEAVYPKNSEKDTEFYLDFVKKRGLLYTAGSDYHGIENDSSHGEIGEVTLTGEPLEKFLEALNRHT